MKFGVISDIHANLPALNAVLQHAQQHNIKTIYNLGDMLGYGAFPDQVINELKSNNIISILGNYDRKVLKVKKKADKWSKSKKTLKWLAFKWAYDKLSPDNLIYLHSLPETRRIKYENLNILLVHGSPASRQEPIYQKTSDERLAELAKMAEADIVFCGHTHQSLVKHFNRTFFINPGSVGRQNDGDPRAAYAIITINKSEVSIHQFRLPYNINIAADEIRKQKLPEEFALMTLYGCDLETIENYTQINQKSKKISIK